MDLTHEQAFDYIEKHHIQLWWDRKAGKWTAQFFQEEPHIFIQESTYGLVVAIQLIKDKLDGQLH